MKKYAVIVAGGIGVRMGADKPKQFLQLNNKPVLYFTLKTFFEAFPDLQIILVLPVDFMDLGQEIVDAWFDKDKVQLVKGGETRFHSVKNGLALVEEDSIIFVHDGVRCLITTDLIQKCYNKALETGSAIPVVTSGDSVRLLQEEANQAVDRNLVMLVQTPQTFHGKILLPAFNIDYKDKFTDEATVVEAYGLKVSLVDGEEQNIKITKPVDLIVAQEILNHRQKQFGE